MVNSVLQSNNVSLQSGTIAAYITPATQNAGKKSLLALMANTSVSGVSQQSASQSSSMTQAAQTTHCAQLQSAAAQPVPKEKIQAAPKLSSKNFKSMLNQVTWKFGVSFGTQTQSKVKKLHFSTNAKSELWFSQPQLDVKKAFLKSYLKTITEKEVQLDPQFLEKVLPVLEKHPQLALKSLDLNQNPGAAAARAKLKAIGELLAKVPNQSVSDHQLDSLINGIHVEALQEFIIKHPDIFKSAGDAVVRISPDILVTAIELSDKKLIEGLIHSPHAQVLSVLDYFMDSDEGEKIADCNVEPAHFAGGEHKTNVYLRDLVDKDSYHAGFYFRMGSSTVPVLLGAMKYRNTYKTEKKYRGFTSCIGLDTPRFAIKSWPVTKGAWNENNCHLLRCNLSHELVKAMQALKSRPINASKSDAEILQNADIRFTLDNGDTHDIAVHFYPKQDENGIWSAGIKIFDSIPKAYQDKMRPGQHEAYESFSEIASAFFSHLGLPSQMSDIQTQVQYTNAQLGGFCTSHALFALEDVPPGPAANPADVDRFFQGFIQKCEQAKKIARQIPYAAEILKKYDSSETGESGASIFTHHMDRLIDAARMDWRNVHFGMTSDRYGTHHKGDRSEPWYKLVQDENGALSSKIAHQNLIDTETGKSYERLKVEQSQVYLSNLDMRS